MQSHESSDRERAVSEPEPALQRIGWVLLTMARQVQDRRPDELIEHRLNGGTYARTDE